MSELEKDLRTAIRELAISASRPDLIWVDTDIPGQQVEICTDYIADRLAELGYVKVVRCGECVEWHPGSPCENCTEHQFCSAGERVVAKDATGEEGK